MGKEKINCPKGYAQIVCDYIKTLDPDYAKRFEVGDYCGFHIIDLSKTFGSPEFRVGGASTIELDSGNRLAMKFMAADTFEDAKHFIDQILFIDNTFAFTAREIEQQHEEKCKKDTISLLLQNA